MFESLKHLLGFDQPPPPPPRSRGTTSEPTDVATEYFALSEEIVRAKSAGDFAVAVKAARETYPILARFIRKCVRDYGASGIVTSHAVHTAPSLMAVLEDSDSIQHLRTTLEASKELHRWLPAADEAEDDLKMVSQLMAAIRADPGLLQSGLKKRLGLLNASRASQLVAWLEKGRRIFRVKKASSYQLYPSGFVVPGANPVGSSEPTRARPDPVQPRAQTPRKRIRRPANKARLLELAGLPVVRLPKAPAYWEERDGRAKQSGLSSSDSDSSSKTTGGLARFTVEGIGWSLAREDKLAPAERPDPSFKRVFHTGAHTYWLDPKGRREGFEFARSVLRVTDRDGDFIAERGLAHDVYREDVSANGSGILFLSREGVLHGYTEKLEPFIEEHLAELPEYEAQADRFGITPDNLKNHVRCVAIASDRSFYIVTVVDEAWCIDVSSRGIRWGFRFPSKEGWTRRVADRSESAGTSAEVQAAIDLMELHLPISPEDIVRQYRTLAMRWHPDRNPRDPGATSKFQALGNAMELLTGADLSRLSGADSERVTYEQVLWTTAGSTSDAERFTVTASMVVGEAFASDWIYAANLGDDGRAFLASYSGKVVVISPAGDPERVYDIGSVPRQVVESGDRFYILTDTRLYVLSGDRLEGLVDVFQADIVVTDTGFALIEAKSLTWFSSSGERIGVVRTKDPLRRVFSSVNGLVVETRQHRALIAGVPSWWHHNDL
jgi:hypothetical protein